MSEEVTGGAVKLLDPTMDIKTQPEAACPRPGPWFADAEPEQAQGCVWPSAALSQCDSSACTFCHGAQLQATQLRQTSAAPLTPAKGIHRRVLSRHGRPHHQHQKAFDQAGKSAEGGQLQGRSMSLMSGIGHKRSALSPLRERQGLCRPAGMECYDRHTPLAKQRQLLDDSNGQVGDMRRTVFRCSSLTQEMSFSKRARTSARASFDATSSLRRGLCQDQQAPPPWVERAGPSQLTQLATARASTSSPGASPYVVQALEFSPDGMCLASLGTSKTLHVYSLEDCELRNGGGCEQPTLSPIYTHHLFGRLSALSWSPWQEGVVAVGDCDGLVVQLHVPSGHVLAELDDEASGSRVYSIAHSRLRYNLVAAAGADGTARLWSGPCMSQSAGTISMPSRAPLMCVDFCPNDENLIALASSDSHAYLYDMRWLNRALKIVDGHTAAVSYVKFMGREHLITSSLDATIACWDLDASVAAPRRISSPAMRFSGHTHREKKLIGLSVLPEEGLIASGSETSRAFAYHMARSSPLADLELKPSPSSSSLDFVSSVCWQPRTLSTAAAFGAGPIMAAAITADDIRLLRLDDA